MGRIVAVCKYMAHDKVQTRLKNSIRSIDDAGLSEFDSSDPKPDYPPNLDSFKAAHKKQFNAMYEAGIKKFREEIWVGAHISIRTRTLKACRWR